MNRESIRVGFMPWAGLALGTLGAGLAHQIGMDSTFQDCRVGSPLVVTIGAIVGLILILLGAAGSWRAYGTESESSARRFIAIISMMSCGLYAIAVVLPFIAAMMIPRCWH